MGGRGNQPVDVDAIIDVVDVVEVVEVVTFTTTLLGPCTAHPRWRFYSPTNSMAATLTTLIKQSAMLSLNGLRRWLRLCVLH